MTLERRIEDAEKRVVTRRFFIQWPDRITEGSREVDPSEIGPEDLVVTIVYGDDEAEPERD